jgi:hypothetical protein
MLKVDMNYFATIEERCDCKLVTYADGRSPLAILNDNSISELAKL